MVETLLLDQELGSASVARVQNRQRQVAETWDYYGLDLSSTAIVGGAALAMYGMDGRPAGIDDEHRFDTDFMTGWSGMKNLIIKIGRASLVERMEETGEEAEFQLYPKGDYPFDAFNRSIVISRKPFTEVTLSDAIDASEVLRGVGGPGEYRVVHPRASGAWKLMLARPKDIVGILQGLASAHQQGLSIAEDPGWRAVVERAADMVDVKLTEAERPTWLAQLKQRPGGLRSHAAFAFLDRS